MALPRLPKQDATGFCPVKTKEEREHEDPA